LTDPSRVSIDDSRSPPIGLTIFAAVGVGILSAREPLTHRACIVAPVIIVRIAVLVHCSLVLARARITISIPEHRRITPAQAADGEVTEQKPARVTVEILGAGGVVQALKGTLEHAERSLQ
jgi:hypothetical protein